MSEDIIGIGVLFGTILLAGLGFLIYGLVNSDKPRRELRRVRRAWQAADDALESIDEIARRHIGLVETALTSEIHEVLHRYRRSLRR